MTIPSSDSQKLFEFNNSYLLLPSVFFSKQNPTIVCSPKVVMLNHDLARSINLPISNISDDDAAAFFQAMLFPMGQRLFLRRMRVINLAISLCWAMAGPIF